MKQNKKWMLVAIALLTLVALPLVGCKHDADEAHTHTYGDWVGDANTYKVTEKCTVCGQSREIPDFVYVKGGTVEGAKMTEGVFEGRKVTLSAFFMGKYEVTQAEWKAVMTGNKNGIPTNPSNFEGDNLPVEMVSWYDAVYFCNELSKKLNLTPAYDITVKEVSEGSISDADVELNDGATGFRLPTEAEWEYAARGGDQTANVWNYLFSGADTAAAVGSYSRKNPGLDQVGWYWYNIINGETGDKEPTPYDSGYGTHEVGKKNANSLGIHDMTGNVLEWCWDWHDEDPKAGDGSSTSVTNPTGPAEGSGRVNRGGSWFGTANNCRVSNRLYFIPDRRENSLGFRVVRPAK